MHATRITCVQEMPAFLTRGVVELFGLSEREVLDASEASAAGNEWAKVELLAKTLVSDFFFPPS